MSAPEETPAGIPFDGHSSKMREDSPWLASEDLLGKGDVKVTIAGCYFHKNAEFDDGRKESVYALAFDKAKKQLVLNSTNRRRLVALFGADVSKWKGKTIALHVIKLRAFGEETNGIRIR